MKKTIILSGTITNALKARDTLQNNSCKATVFRKMGKDAVGCGYAVNAQCDQETVKKILQKNNIKYIDLKSSEEP